MGFVKGYETRNTEDGDLENDINKLQDDLLLAKKALNRFIVAFSSQSDLNESAVFCAKTLGIIGYSKE